MELTKFDIIKRPLLTTKTIELYRKLGQYTFEVHVSANKLAVRDAVQQLWSVKVEKVRILNVHGKNKAFNRRPFTTSNRKKAIISLKKGFKIEIPGLFEAMNAPQAYEQSEAEGR
jgi:large subunit ribosomal protein L23